MVKLMGLLPVPAVGFPLSKPPVVKVRPSAEMALAPLVMEKLAAGNPFATNWKLPDAPLVKVVALALVLEIPDEQWQRLVRLVGNEGEDSLLDRVIATRSPQRCIGGELLYPKPYGRLQTAIDAERPQQASLLRDFVDHWYLELGNGARSGKYKQAAAFKHPYWYRYGDENFAGGAYFGRWCVEAAAAVKVFGLDDQLCLGHEHYPQAFLHEQADLPSPPVIEREKRGFWARLLGK